MNSILIGVPYYKTTDPRFFMSLMSAILRTHDSARWVCRPEFVKGTIGAKQRNLLSRWCIKHDFDYLLTVDDDMIFSEVAILDLLEVDKDIVGGVYVGRIGETKNNIQVFHQDA